MLQPLFFSISCISSRCILFCFRSSVRGAKDLEKTLTVKPLLFWLPVKNSFVWSRRVHSRVHQQRVSFVVGIGTANRENCCANRSLFQCESLMYSLSRPYVFEVSYSTGAGSVCQNGGLLRRVSFVHDSRHPRATAITFAHAREPRRAMCFVCVLGSVERIHLGFDERYTVLTGPCHSQIFSGSLETRVCFCDVPFVDCTTTCSVRNSGWLKFACAFSQSKFEVSIS